MNNETCSPNSLRDIDVHFDFTFYTPGFREGFSDRRDGLGVGGADPDLKSPYFEEGE